MGVTIQTITVPSGTEKTARISQGYMAHSLTVGSTWNKLRVGFRIGLTNASDGSITLTPRLLLGLCSGTSFIPGSGNVQNSLLFRSTAANWNVGGGGGVLGHCSFQGAEWATYHTGGTIATVSSNANNGYFCRIARPDHATFPGITVILIEIEKGSSWTGRVVAPFPSSIGPNISTATLTTAMQVFDINSTPGVLDGGGNYTVTTNSLGSNPVQESTRGYLDAVCMHWDRFTQNMDFGDVIIARYI